MSLKKYIVKMFDKEIAETNKNIASLQEWLDSGKSAFPESIPASITKKKNALATIEKLRAEFLECKLTKP